jgi:hypothetical protein
MGHAHFNSVGDVGLPWGREHLRHRRLDDAGEWSQLSAGVVGRAAAGGRISSADEGWTRAHATVRWRGRPLALVHRAVRRHDACSPWHRARSEQTMLGRYGMVPDVGAWTDTSFLHELVEPARPPLLYRHVSSSQGLLLKCGLTTRSGSWRGGTCRRSERRPS